MIESKYTINDVKEMLAIDGYTLKEYDGKVNTRTKFTCICKNNHLYKTDINNWKNGKRCSKCSRFAPLGIDRVRNELTKEGYILLEKEHINANTTMRAICDKGHHINIFWSNWSRGVRCAECSGNKRKDMDFIRTEFEKEGYILLSKRYKNSQSNLWYLCNSGHKHYMTYSNWFNGKRCPECSLLKRSGENHYNWQGGISCEPYCDVWLDKDFKESIKERDGYECRNPNCYGVTDKLVIHHIDYNKKNCSPNNLITVCRSCNSRANKNREWHKKFYKNIMMENLNG